MRGSSPARLKSLENLELLRAPTMSSSAMRSMTLIFRFYFHSKSLRGHKAKGGHRLITQIIIAIILIQFNV